MEQTMTYQVTFTNSKTGAVETSHIFDTLRAAQKWAKWLANQNFVSSTKIYKGGAGGEVIG